MSVSVDELRPMNNDVILLQHSVNEENTIYIRENEDEETTMMFEVLRTSPNVQHVSIGDIAVIPWRRCTPPFEAYVNGVAKMVTITDEKEILGLLEK